MHVNCYLSQEGRFSYGILILKSEHWSLIKRPTASTKVMYRPQMLNLLMVSPRIPSAETFEHVMKEKATPYCYIHACNRNASLNSRGVSSDITTAIGPVKPPQPLISDELISWNDHQLKSARFNTRSALTESTCKY